MVSPAIVILGPSALPLAGKLKQELGGIIHGPRSLNPDITFDRATDHIAQLFAQGETIIGLCASGILIRAIAAELHDKHSEPPVIAVAEDGSSVVPLLGGHHGAIGLARKIASLTGGHAAITTASEVRFGESFDEPAPGLVLGNPDHMKAATAAKLRGEAVEVVTTEKAVTGHDRLIVQHPLVLTVGVGCERHTEPAEVAELIANTLAAHNLSPRAVACHASIDVKEDEAAITALPDVRYFTAAELNAESNRLQNPSAIVAAEVGTPSVAEAAALAAAGPEATLIVPKTKSKRATCAIAIAPAPVLTPAGRPRGVLHVVGIGPGGAETRSPSATAALRQSTDWVGYGLYLDLAADVKRGQQGHRFPLGGEEDRCRAAIELAKQGKTVSLVCSGDAAIYAMAALVYELIDREPCRIGVEVHPGISAFQLASARAGAMIGHDFCCISLSDLLTPWATIEQRLHAAAQGDFVISFYNPRSLKRRDQIERAFAILKPHRKPETPVVLASNLGRVEEKVRILRFDQFDPDDVDMLTLVMVGSSQSKAITRGDGRTYAYTPRGYAKKMDHKS